jgi:hypothetical protein
MGPTVAPGLPLLMALARALSACGPYFVVPLCGSLLVLMTFELGRRLFSAGTGLVAALLVASSPVVFFQSLVVMADVPAAAFWTSALVAALTGTPRGALLAGALSGIAILIRPNLLPLALFPWLMALLRCDAGASAFRRTASFALGSVPSALFIAWLNHRLYGSPFTSGYGDIGGAFAIAHASRNIGLYARWWLESQGPAAFLFLAAAWRPRTTRLREVVVLVAYAACVVLMYLFYLPFDQWWYLRFLVPAVPVAFLLCAAAVDRATAWSPSLRAIALLAFVAVAASHAVRFIASKDILTNSAAERRRYLDAARYVDATIPRNAIVLAMQHSGSIRYYAGRLTMRWDVVDPGSFDQAVAALRAHEVPVYALLEGWEEEDFRRRFAGRHLGDPIASTADGEVRLYAVDPVPAGVGTAVMPRIDDDCVDASPDFVYPDGQRRLAAAGASSRGRALER